MAIAVNASDSEQSFAWNSAKADENFRKHGVTFSEGEEVFYDFHSVTTPDPLHSFGEERYIDIGMSKQGRLLVVVYVERGDVIRIISARPATKDERKLYESETEG